MILKLMNINITKGIKDIIFDFKCWVFNTKKYWGDWIDVSDVEEVVNKYMWENKLYGEEIFNELVKIDIDSI